MSALATEIIKLSITAPKNNLNLNLGDGNENVLLFTEHSTERVSAILKNHIFIDSIYTEDLVLLQIQSNFDILDNELSISFIVKFMQMYESLQLCIF